MSRYATMHSHARTKKMVAAKDATTSRSVFTVERCSPFYHTGGELSCLTHYAK